jgi:hypothetical protein
VKFGALVIRQSRGVNEGAGSRGVGISRKT